MKKQIVAAMLTLALIAGPAQQALASDFMWPDDIYSMAEEIAEPYHISPSLIEAMIWQESRYAVDAQNDTCIGLMQINETYHKERMQRLGVTDLRNPYDNIKVGVDYLAEILEKNEEISLALDVYNGRSNAYELYEAGKQSPYAKKILLKAYEIEEERGLH